MAMTTFPKDSDSVLPWEVRCARWLANEGGDTIETAEVLVPDGLVLEAVQIVDNDTTVRIWLSGGSEVDGTKLLVTCRIHTAGGRTEDKSFLVKMRDN